MNILTVLRSGLVHRWHSNPDMAHHSETLAEHQWSTAMIALKIDPYLSKDALIYALTHDVGEMRTGDWPAPFKRDEPEMRQRGAEMERDFRRKNVGPESILTDHEHRVVKIADWISAAFTVIRHEPWLFHREVWRRQWIGIREYGMLLPDQTGLVKTMLSLATMANERGVKLP
jgi:hypothetical protein